MECDLRLNKNSKCKGAKYFGETCGRLRPFLCDVRIRIDAAKARAKRRVPEGRAEEPLGIGA